ncbi:MAG TPA: cytochrome c oxidase subunit II [Gaiellaceae bacterium]|nr:cytochrome c oxidase subunit II [Gaiellaceae bacterium]
MRRGSLVRIGGLAVFIAVILALVATLFQWLPHSGSKQMDRITDIYWFATIVSIGIFSIVASVIIYSVIHFRAQPGDDSDGPPIHGHTGLEIVWTAIPALLVLAIGTASAIVLSQNGRAGTNPMHVTVIAQQFEWTFQYPDEQNLKSHELVVPLGRTIRFDMDALDVIHSFWVPEWGQKQDAVPGIHTHVIVTPTKLGHFTVICTELCGLGHATMRAAVEVVSPADFASWVKQQQSGGGNAGAGGAALFTANGCGGCHTFKPAGSSGKIGPDLDNLAADAQKAGQPLAAYVKQSIVDPDAYIVPGYQKGVMPTTFGQSLSAQQVDTLVTFLSGGSS